MQRTEVQPLLDRLADFVCAHRDEITQGWIDSVQRNPDIHSAEHLTFRELVDHLPQLFDDLANRLRRAGAKSTGATAEHSHEHGSHRWRQGYALGELLREIGIIRRTIFLDCVAKFEEQNADFNADVRREAEEIIHRFFTDMTVESAEQFVQDQQWMTRRVNTELEETVQQLNEANRQMKEIGESRLRLLRTISHDLGNSLNAISTAANVLQEEGDDAVRHKMLLVLHRSIADMGALLQQLLSYSSLIEGRARPMLQPFETRLLFDDLVSTYAPLAQAKGLTLQADCDPALGVVVSDRVKVAQIATNLLSNAIKYGKPEGADEALFGSSSER